MDNEKMINRRTLLKGLAAVPVVAAVGFHGTAAAAELDPNDPKAKALEYTKSSPNADQTCSNCNLFQDGNKCSIFPGNTVAPGGWCKSWVGS
ncbi:MAG: high-potential iron-sulfur protein [Pseudomonadota bacterium]